MILQTFIAAEGQVYKSLRILRDLFIKYRVCKSRNSAASLKSIFLESQKELGIDYNLDIAKLNEVDNLDKQVVRDFFENKFNSQHYSVCKKIHEKLKITILKLKTRQFSEHQLNKIIYATYKVIDNANMNLHWFLSLNSKEHITSLEDIICSLEQLYFNQAKEILEPIVSKVYFKLAIILFPYLKQSSDNIIATKNLFDKSAISTFIDRSLYFTVSLLNMEQKINDPLNSFKFKAIKQEISSELAVIKTKLKKKQKNFFSFLMNVLEGKVFYISQNGYGTVIKLNNDLSLWIFTKLHKLCDLYFQIFMTKKIIDGYEKKSSTDSLAEEDRFKEYSQDDFDLYFQIFISKNTISTIIGECEKPKSIELLNIVEPIKAFTQEEILDFLNFSLKVYNTEENNDNLTVVNNQENKENIKHKIIRIFPDIPKPKQDLLIDILEDRDLKLKINTHNKFVPNISSNQQKSNVEEQSSTLKRKESYFVHSPYSYFNSMGWQEPSYGVPDSYDGNLNDLAMKNYPK